MKLHQPQRRFQEFEGASTVSETRANHRCGASVPDCVESHASLPVHPGQSGSWRDRTPKTGVMPRGLGVRSRRGMRETSSLSILSTKYRRETGPRGPAGRRHGIALIECMVYIAVVMTILGIGLSLYLKLLSFHRDLERNATDITRSIKAGELWRADIRSAVGPIESTHSDKGSVLVIPTAIGSIRYHFDQQTLWRQDELANSETIFLQGVTQCEFIQETRSKVNAWRFEIQLKTKLKTVRVQPKFSFLAVNRAERKANEG